VPRLFPTFVLLSVALALTAGCVARRPAPVVERPPQGKPAPSKPAAAKPAAKPGEPQAEFYIVKKGDTLYSIALDHGLDYRELAQWNGVTDPGAIRVGQQLRLRPPAGAVTTAPAKTAPSVQGRPLETPVAPAPGGNVKTEPQAVRAPYSDQAYAQMSGAKPEPAPAKPEGDDGVSWGWPATGKVVGTFNEGANLKGIAIAGKLGQPVLASAPGRVIFSGTGIRGFGKLIVIKHNNTYLSVYGHNNELLVKEGQSVAKGQKIAEMGSTDTDQVKLHFEIRRFGKPVDPATLLPPQ
jgi:lipoprotein NlpD